jgi:predicted NBD/HSP70 family sugar kinase
MQSLTVLVGGARHSGGSCVACVVDGCRLVIHRVRESTSVDGGRESLAEGSARRLRVSCKLTAVGSMVCSRDRGKRNTRSNAGTVARGRR